MIGEKRARFHSRTKYFVSFVVCGGDQLHCCVLCVELFVREFRWIALDK